MSNHSRLLQGDATYLGDLRDDLVDGAAHAVFVRSQMAHAAIGVDVSHAQTMPGVLLVLDGATNTAWPTRAYSEAVSARFAQPLLAEKKVRYVGEPVVAIVAETVTQAVEAGEQVIIDYEPLPVVSTVAASISGETLLFDDESLARRNGRSVALVDDPPTNVVLDDAMAHVDGAHDPAQFEADIVVDQWFRNPRQLAAPIECRGAVAVWDGADDLHVWLSTQTPHSFRKRIAPIYDLELSQIHVVAGPDVGGGFGGKGAPGPEEQLIPELARRVGRPVRWIESRTENLTGAPQGRAEDVRIVLAGDQSGRLHAIRAEILKEAGAYPSSGAGLPHAWSRSVANGVYDIAHVEFSSTVAVTNRPPVSALRGAGRSPIIAALERAIDMFAVRCGLDPVEMRARNMIQPESMPFTTPTGSVYDEADYPAAMSAAIDRASYGELRTEQQSRRDRGDETQLGIGIANYVHRTNGGSTEQAIVRIEADGAATVITGTTDQGQGHATTWAAIAGDELGIDPSRITVIEGVTDLIDNGIGAIGSRSLQTAGMAVHVAAGEVVGRAISVAADMFEAAAADVCLDRERGAFHVVGTPSRTLSWVDIASEVATRADVENELSCDYTYDPLGRDVFPSGCHVAAVEVDTRTGECTLRSFVAADDAGVRVDEAVVDAQLHGGIALGVAQVLGEISDFDDDGNPLRATFLDYQIATIDQMCQFDLVPQTVASSVNVCGYKAVGESGPIGATPAVHNAVIDALSHLGIDHIDIPCTPQVVWKAIVDAN